LEHEVLRARFKEPRIHFALVCAAVGCPALRAAAYRGDRIGEQLEEQARLFHRQPRHLRWDAESKVLHLSAIYDWFGKDFTGDGETVITVAARYAPPAVAESLRRHRDRLTVKYLDYDWSLNGQ
jgi:hypothetical protein